MVLKIRTGFTVHCVSMILRRYNKSLILTHIRIYVWNTQCPFTLFSQSDVAVKGI